jgi:hypothetical protein
MRMTKQERAEAKARFAAEDRRQSARRDARDEAAASATSQLVKAHAPNFEPETMDFDELPKWLADAISDSERTAIERADEAAETAEKTAAEQAYDAVYLATFNEVLEAEFAIALAKRNGTYDYENERIKLKGDNVVALSAA